MATVLNFHIEDLENCTGMKDQFFYEGHKILHNILHCLDIYFVNVQTMRKIAQILVAFSEKLNFTIYKKCLPKKSITSSC